MDTKASTALGTLVAVETLPDGCRGHSGICWPPVRRTGIQKAGTRERSTLGTPA